MRVHSINPPSPRRNEQLPDRLGSNGGQPARAPRDPDNPRFLLSFRFFDRTRAPPADRHVLRPRWLDCALQQARPGGPAVGLSLTGSASLCVIERQHACLQEFDSPAAVHGALERLQSVDLTFGLAVARRFRVKSVRRHASRGATGVLQVVLPPQLPSSATRHNGSNRKLVPKRVIRPTPGESRWAPAI
jgi:hypothetical protein